MTNEQCVAYAILGMLEAGLDADKVLEVEKACSGRSIASQKTKPWKKPQKRSGAKNDGFHAIVGEECRTKEREGLRKGVSFCLGMIWMDAAYNKTKNEKGGGKDGN